MSLTPDQIKTQAEGIYTQLCIRFESDKPLSDTTISYDVRVIAEYTDNYCVAKLTHSLLIAACIDADNTAYYYESKFRRLWFTMIENDAYYYESR